MSWDQRDLVRDALAELGTRRLLLAIHDASFPSDPDEDVGAGSPATRAASRLLELARSLGFTGLQLGPAGETSRANASPYDGTIFSRAIASIPAAVFAPGGAFAGLVAPATLAAIHGDGGDRGDHRRAHDVTHALVAEASSALARGARPELIGEVDRFRTRHRRWLERDALAAAMTAGHPGAPPAAGHPDATLWLDDDPARIARREQLAREHAAAMTAYAFGQLVAHHVHDQVQDTARRLGLALYVDLQIGMAPVDAWVHAAAFLPGYLLGAPPSRTDPGGQAWNYPVWHPGRVGPDGAARALVRDRADKAFAEHDSARIDHPHGLVCPWVYRADTGEALAAVRAGARLLESPDLGDHPALAQFAVVAADQLDPTRPRHADDRVRELTPAQVDRYAILFDEVIDAARRHGRDPSDLTCEVLSTMPRPLARVIERHGLGRWRVLQKANLDDPGDVYRPERAAPPDWVMLGNHDTPSIAGLHASWTAATRGRWAEHLGSRLALAPTAIAALAASPGLMASAMLAELLACPAANALVSFPDLFGEEARLNVPGTVSDRNWSLRVPATFAERYRERLEAGRALCLPLACALALRARRSPSLALITALERLAAAAGTPPPAAAAAD